MNETSKLAVYKEVKKTLTAVVTEIGAKLTVSGHKRDSSWIMSPLDDDRIDIEITYTHYTHTSDGGPRLYLGEGSKQVPLKNLSHANLKAHLLKRLNASRAYLAEMALDDAKDAAVAKAEEATARLITTELDHKIGSNFSHDVVDDYHIWRPGNNPSNFFKLAYTGAEGKPGDFTFVYNFEYNVNNGKAHLQGEFDASTLVVILATIRALNNL